VLLVEQLRGDTADRCAAQDLADARGVRVDRVGGGSDERSSRFVLSSSARISTSRALNWSMW
jgi:hypothetical protein